MGRRISSGMVYQRKYRDRHGAICKTKTWTIKYYIQGKAVCVSTGTDDREEAVRILRQRLAKAAHRSLYSEHMERWAPTPVFWSSQGDRRNDDLDHGLHHGACRR